MSVGSNWAVYPPSEHPPASERWKITTTHIQASAEEAALRGWYYRPVRYESLVPDTRKCIHCFKIIFDPLPLTQDQKALRNPLSTNVLLGEPPLPDDGVTYTTLSDGMPDLRGNDILADL